MGASSASKILRRVCGPQKKYFADFYAANFEK
jgi:hypothetical protein